VIENSPAGLVMMVGEVTVTVTREDHHQPALDPYRVSAGGQRDVAVELAWCTVRAGKHRGERAIEVRLDGRRVGELTHLMSERYGALVRQVAAGGGRPGCEAFVQRGAKGLEITLRLPRAAGTVAPAFGTAPAAPMPPVPPRTGRRAGWIAAGVVGTIAFFGIIGSTMDPSTTSSPSNVVTEKTTTHAPPTTETTTTSATPKPKPVATAPRVTTPKPKPAPPVRPKPKPASTCDPNYTGCVPVASDVDCAGGSGNGPAYAVGPVDVIGRDVYDLDRDGDDVACE
jgi:hypothetical protein